MPLRWPNRLRCSREGRWAAPSVAHRPRAAFQPYRVTFSEADGRAGNDWYVTAPAPLTKVRGYRYIPRKIKSTPLVVRCRIHAFFSLSSSRFASNLRSGS
jgi:hypothetical protein